MGGQGLILGAQAAAGRGVRQEKVETHRKERSPGGWLIAVKVSEPPRDQNTDSLCMWSPQQSHSPSQGRAGGDRLCRGTWAPSSLPLRVEL